MPQGQVHWYSIQITQDRFPWAFNDGNPQRRIAALEMLGTVFLIRLAAWHRTHRNIDITVRGITDSECNSYAMLKSYSSKMPGAAVHMELMSMARHLGVWPRISHRRRAENQWADSLTESNFQGFDTKRRWEPVLNDKFFFLLDHLDALVRGAA